MINAATDKIGADYRNFISNRTFPCIGAKAAMGKNQASYMISGNMACPSQDKAILQYLYDFTDQYRAKGGLFHSAAVIFSGPVNISEDIFEKLMWQRLEALAILDATLYGYDTRVSPDPSSPHFSFSLKEEAFFIIGMHPASSRAARRFNYPALTFNPHAQFETLKQTDKYAMIKGAVRKRDIIFSGSINPMMNDHGRASEILQYSGKNYQTPLHCPLKINHAVT